MTLIILIIKDVCEIKGFQIHFKYLVFFFLCGLEIELRALGRSGKHSATELLLEPFYFAL